MRCFLLSVLLLLVAATARAELSMGLGKAAAKRAASVIDKGKAAQAASAAAKASGSTTSARLKWAVTIGETFNYSSPAVAADGTVYMGSSNHFVYYNDYWNLGQKPPPKPYGLYAFNSDGTQKWKYSDGTDAAARGSPVIAPDGTIYMTFDRLGASQAATTEELHAVTPLGAQKWKVVISTVYSQIGTLAPSVAPDGSVYVPGRDTTAFNPNGTLKWKVYASQSNTSLYFGSPAIAPDGTIYTVVWSTYGVGGQALRAFNSDGTFKWDSPDLGTYPISSSPSIAADGTIYLGIHDTNALSGATNAALVAFSSATGAVKWAFPAVDFDVRCQPTVDADGTIYIGTKGNSGFVYAVNPNGTVKWSHATVNDVVCPGCGTDVYNSPVIGTDGTIYVANELAVVYAFNPDGTILWMDPNLVGTGGFTESSAALISDGTLYIGNAYGKFIAVRTGSLGMKAAAAWPRFHYDLLNGGAKP